MGKFNNLTLLIDDSNRTEWAILNPANNIFEFIDDTSISELAQTYDKVPTWMLTLSFILIPISIALNLFVVNFEKFEMDSKKRGIINQVKLF